MSKMSAVTISSPLASHIEEYQDLASLALDVSLTWKTGNVLLWQKIDSELWSVSQDPWAVLQASSRKQLESLNDDPDFRRELDRNLQIMHDADSAPSCFDQNHAESGLKTVAYFSMEYMVSGSLPIYSGGLGNVAGDQLKAASDLGVPVVGVGLLYQQGYFRQIIDHNGNQQECYPPNDPWQMPITPVCTDDGEWLRLKIDLPGSSIWLRVWQVKAGRVKLYLLDTNDIANPPIYRGIAGELYGGNSETRLQQEIVLGIGGWRLLEALGIKPEVCHLNEGHAAFSVLERAFGAMQETGHPFDVALTVTRSGNLFTTHTAAKAGFDRFEPALMQLYFGKYAQMLGISFDDLLALGRANPSDPNEPFNMAYLAIRGSGSVNGVSKLHGEISRKLFGLLFPRYPESEVPISHVTNGIHVPSWSSQSSDELVGKTTTEVCTKSGLLSSQFKELSDEQLWSLRTKSITPFIDFIRATHERQIKLWGADESAIELARHVLDPNILTIGFARRFATYKRPNLLLHDAERLIRILKNNEYPVQIVLAGKAHPADQFGKDLIRQWVEFIRGHDLNHRVIFLIDYDMLMTQKLVVGIDVWLNTPRRPWEACGTSGMKTLANGGINFSELDGWWAEAYTPEIGWALGDGELHDDDNAQDAEEANALYEILEKQIIPEFYDRDSSGIPRAWVSRMRQSMATLTEQYSAARAVKDYVEQHYLPSAANYLARSKDNAALGITINNWRKNIEQRWSGLRFGTTKVSENGGKYQIEVEVYLNQINQADIKVSLYANGLNNESATTIDMKPGSLSSDSIVYFADICANRPASDFTARITPNHPQVSVPLECPLILWQH